MKSLLAMFFLLLSVSTLENCLAGPVEDIGDLGNTENEEVPMEEADTTTQELQQFIEMNATDSRMRVKRASCSCSGLQCSCCQRVSIRAINFNENCCATVKYLNKDFGVAFTITVGSKTTFSKEIYASDPPPICFPIPKTKKAVQACADFYNMALSKTALTGCLNVLIKVPLLGDPSFNLGCFTLKR